MSAAVRATAQRSFSVLLESGVTTSETDLSLIHHQVCIFSDKRQQRTSCQVSRQTFGMNYETHLFGVY